MSARPSRLSLRARLALVLVAFTAVVLLVQDIPLAGYLRGVERDRIITGLERDAFTLAGRSATTLASTPATQATQARSGAATADLQATVTAYAQASRARVVVTDARGVAVVTSGDGEAGTSFANRPEIAAALSGRSVSGERPSQTLGQDLLYVAVPVRSGTTILGTVRITYPAKVVDASVNRRVRGLALVGLVTLGSAAVIGLLLASAVTVRLRRFEEATERIAGGDLGARVGPQTSTELQALGTSFDSMADRLEHLVEAQRGFAGDASHQLRTPLTAMRVRLDRAAELVHDDPDAALVTIDAVREETDRMQRLVDGLLTLARADGSAADPVRVEVASLVRERADTWRALAEERGVAITASAPAQAWAWALPGAVEQVVDNYVDNALEVAPDGTSVDLVVTAGAGAVDVLVADRGAGLSAEDRERAFDRFWRGGAEGGGSGLGLAVVRSLAEAGGGSVGLDARPGGGTVARVTLRPAPGA